MFGAVLCIKVFIIISNAVLESSHGVDIDSSGVWRTASWTHSTKQSRSYCVDVYLFWQRSKFNTTPDNAQTLICFYLFRFVSCVECMAALYPSLVHVRVRNHTMKCPKIIAIALSCIVRHFGAIVVSIASRFIYRSIFHHVLPKTMCRLRSFAAFLYDKQWTKEKCSDNIADNGPTPSDTSETRTLCSTKETTKLSADNKFAMNGLRTWNVYSSVYSVRARYSHHTHVRLCVCVCVYSSEASGWWSVCICLILILWLLFSPFALRIQFGAIIVHDYFRVNLYTVLWFILLYYINKPIWLSVFCAAISSLSLVSSDF